MTTIRALFAMIALAGATTACSENGSGVTVPDGAFYDGGHTFGGGNRGDTANTTTTATSDEDAVVEAPSSGGHTFGGGN